MSERPQAGEQAVLVHVELQEPAACEELAELEELVRSAGVCSVGVVRALRRVPEAKYFVGLGKAEEIRDLVRKTAAEVVLFNHTLSPAQARNLGDLTGCRVLDRTDLILDIFAQRARTFEGNLQVELAQLEHMSTRLVRGWTHLERQKGGIGLRGPGEKQLETDRRLLGLRIRQLHRRLEKVRRQRAQGRRSRRRAELPTVSLVGYTNAGKSTLFNRLTGAGVLAEDRLFATLDPTLRRLDLGSGGAVVLADTVGFIRHLPHHLVAAFRATLEETREAALLLHVIDAADEQRPAHSEQVKGVLQEIGAAEVPQLEVYNKVDMLPGRRPRAERDRGGRVRRVWLSAATGEGLDLLIGAIREHFGDRAMRRRLLVPPSAGRLRARLYDCGYVRRESIDSSGAWLLEVEAATAGLERLWQAEGLVLGTYTIEDRAA